MDRLSTKLLAMGFFSALGTAENSGLMTPQGKLVKRGTPKTLDSNCGVWVVYDEEGRPWIIEGKKLKSEVWVRLRREFSLQFGAYVPHSNDRGRFLTEILPSL